MNNEQKLVNELIQTLKNSYWTPMKMVVDNKPGLINTIPSFILNPEMIHVYMGEEHLAIEYFGSYNEPIVEREGINVTYYDYSQADNFLDSVLGIKFDNSSFDFPLSGELDDLFIATVDATQILTENNWNFLAQEMMFMINVNGLFLQPGFTRIRNSFFYEKSGQGLNVRNVKWLDIFPLNRISIDDDTEEITVELPELPKLAFRDAHYSIPEKLLFQHDKLIILNRFIELYNSEGITEPEITRFLFEPEHQFIIKMAFFGSEIQAEVTCKWQESDRSDIRPDFFVTGTNGYTDIVEFKLPTIKTEYAVVGRENRETFTAEINSYIAQTRVYKEYFEDPRNRRYVKERYNMDVYYPKRNLVIGRRWMFDKEVWRSIQEDYQSITIRTYDDVVDTVMGYLMS
jgi:hypothetical protein